MKLTTFILIIALAQVSAKGFGQRISLNETNTPLEKVLQSIKEQSGYVFFYDVNDLKDQKISVKLNNVSVEDAVKASLKDLPLSYKIVKNNVVLSKKEPSFLERVVATLTNTDASGRVVDVDGKGLPGASVKVKKTGRAVSTDAKGNFFLRGVEEGAVVVVSFIGYLPKEVSASANMGNVVLEQSLSKLDEVQVIAYGTTTQRLSTGNVTTIKADVIEKQPVNNPLLALQGRVPGLFIEQATGFAGTGVKVRIQGTNSLNNGNDPLYVIDGVPFISQMVPVSIYEGSRILGGSGSNSNSNPLNFINPADIESIDILKDADATAIYGSRAANGAILITTKKGLVGNTKVNINVQSGFGEVGHKLHLMNNVQYLEMRKETLKNDGIASPAEGNFGDVDLNGLWDVTRNNDWQKELLGGTARYNDLQASISGGSNNTNFIIGSGYHRETTVFPGNEADVKASVHFNINTASVNQKFKIQFSGSYLVDNNLLPGIDLTSQAMSLPPVAPRLYKGDGSINWEPDQFGGTTFFYNPVGYLYNKSNNKTSNLVSSAVLSYQIVPGLDLKSNFGYTNILSNSSTQFRLQSVPPEALQFGAVRSTAFGNNTSNSWSVEPQLTFTHIIGKGKLEMLFASTLQQTRNDGSDILASGYSNDLTMEDLRAATKLRTDFTTNSFYKYGALFGRVNYNWDDKYILNLSARRDGSSRFGPENQFHDFSAIGVAWIFSQASFVKDNLKFLSFGKIRASYGTTGSDQIKDYQYLSLYDPLQLAVPYQNVPSYQPNRLTNPYLQWESTKKAQFAIDLGFFDDRLLMNINYYKNRSSNQLSDYSLPATTGFPTIVKNQAFKIQNSGLELNISTTNVKTKDIVWSSNINFTSPKTLLVDYPDLLKSSASSTVVIGAPLSASYVYHFLGVDPATGMYMFADRNGNPTFNPTDANDRVVIVDLAPKFYGGLQNTLIYKGFRLDFLFQFVSQKAKNFNFGNNVPGDFSYGNQLASILNRWQKPGDIAPIQKYSTDLSFVSSLSNVMNSDAAWADASYIRLKNISLSWNLPESWRKMTALQNANFFVQAQNLWTITDYSGLDPETKSSESLPPLRVITLGIKVVL